MEDPTAPAPLFYGVTIAIIPSDELDCEPDQIRSAIESQGGHFKALREDDQTIEDLSAVSHIVSATINFPQYYNAIESGIYVVKPTWVTQSLAKQKLAGARQHSPDPSQYFQDVVVTFAELPEGDKDAITAGVMALGGQYTSQLTKLVTHIVTEDDNNAKCEMAVSKNVRCKIVLPHWFDDCLRLGKKISERPYEFPDPPFYQPDLSRPANSDSTHVEGATTAMPTGPPQTTPPSSPSEARKNLNAFMCKKVKLAPELGLKAHLIETLKGLIEHGGGTLTQDVNQADIYVCQYRDGDDYVAASRARKEVASLSWLYYVVNQNKYTSPLSRLLHYPIPRNGIPGFQNMKISISNYNGDARAYLENLIRYCGAEFTKTMKQDNTHLITAHTKSEKYEAAQEWNVHVVNHLWIEESYAKCTVQSITNPKFNHFPASTNLSEVCGQTCLDMKRVENIFFPVPKESPQKALNTPDAQVKTKLSPRKAIPPSSATIGSPRKSAPVTAPTPIAEDDEPGPDEDEEDQQQATSKPGKKRRSNLSGTAPTPNAKIVDAEDDTEMAPSTDKRPRGRPRKSLATPARLADDEKENVSPLVTGGRAAKQKAYENMSPYPDDFALLAKEQKRKGGVTHGGRRSSHLDDLSSPAPAPESKKGRKRKSDEGTYDVTAEGSDLSDGETQAAKASKKVKTGAPSLPPIKHRVMITGDERWLGNKKQEDADKTKLRLLGVQLTQDPTEVDILVAPAIKRTRKFVAALANAPLVVDTKYLDAALKDNKLVEKPKLLQDPKNEQSFGFKLAEALERAKINQHKLLRGWSILVTKDIPGGFETYKEIITVNGGDAYQYQGRTGFTLPKRRSRDDPEAGSESQHQGDDDEFDCVYLVSGTSEAEVKLWKTFRSLAEKQSLQARIVRSDWLLNAAMRQQVAWDDRWALDEAAVVSQRDR